MRARLFSYGISKHLLRRAKIMRFFLPIFLAILIVLPVSAKAQTQLETLAKNAIILDYETGQVLFEKDADARMPTASMSKTMTIYMVFDAIKNGKLTLEQELPVSEKAWRMQGSKMFVDINTMVKVEDLIRGVIIQSGNDATIVLAEGLAGSEGEFAIAMTRKAKELGMENSNFTNASGWPDPNHYSTARDLAILSKALINDFPEMYKYYSELDFTYHGIKQGNRNPLLYKNIGADGIKTGHTEEAGYGLMASAVRDNRRVIMVVGGLSNMNERSQESTRLMEWALANFKNVDLVKSGERVATSAVAMGMERSVGLVTDKDLKVTMPRMADSAVKREAVFNAPIEAPVQKGQKVGVVRISAPNMKSIEVPLVAEKEIPRLGFFPAMAEKARRMVFGDSTTVYSQ
jgi:D-alanyl-D-alanine carboxypeptidase (penicillin-binding protein 5/6)